MRSHLPGPRSWLRAVVTAAVGTYHITLYLFAWKQGVKPAHHLLGHCPANGWHWPVEDCSNNQAGSNGVGDTTRPGTHEKRMDTAHCSTLLLSCFHTFHTVFLRSRPNICWKKVLNVKQCPIITRGPKVTEDSVPHCRRKSVCSSCSTPPMPLPVARHIRNPKDTFSGEGKKPCLLCPVSAQALTQHGPVFISKPSIKDGHGMLGLAQPPFFPYQCYRTHE